VLRKRWPAGTLDETRLAEAVEDLGALPFRRWPELPLLRRAFELRANLTAYDALYVTLAEGLDCPLVTADARLGRAPGLHCPVTILRTAGG
jgi:predicted nucleic acid-binding protein